MLERHGGERPVQGLLLVRSRGAEDTVDGDRSVGNVRTAVARHVTLDTTVGQALLLPHRHRQTATALALVTLEAAPPVMFYALCRCGALVRIMAGDAAHPPGTLLKTAAGV